MLAVAIVVAIIALAVVLESRRPKFRPHLTHVRGATLITQAEANLRAAAKGHGPYAPPPGFRGFAFGGLWLPFHFAVTGLVWIGAIRSGKTLTFLPFINSVLELVGLRGSAARALIYDPKRSFGRFIDAVLPPHVPVYRLNFLDRRSVWWDLAADFRTPSELIQLAAALVPIDAKEVQKYFREAAQALVAAVLLGLTGVPWTLRDLCLICRNRRRMAHFLARTPEGKDAVDQFLRARSATEVLATLGACLNRLQVAAACWDRAAAAFSVTRFADEEAVLTLEMVDSSSEVQNQLYRLLVRRLSDEILLRDDPRAPTVLCFDELVSLPVDLTPLTTKGRSAGAVVAATVMSVPALEDALGGPLKASGLLDTLLTQAYLRVDADKTAEHCSKQIGEEEVREITLGVSNPTAAPGVPRVINEHQTVKMRRLVTADEIKTLPAADYAGGTVTGYFKLPEVGTYRGDVRFRDQFPPARPNPAVAEYDPRPGDEQRLRPFAAADLARLGVPDTPPTRALFGVA